MEPQDVIAMVLEIVLESERRKKRQLEESLWAFQVALEEKQRERSMLIRKKQPLLGNLATEKKLVNDFMVFIEAIENNDLQTAQNFDENEMMNATVTILNSNGVNVGQNGGFPDNNEGTNCDIENAHNLGALEGTKSDGGEESHASENERD